MSFLEELEKGTNRTAHTANGALSNTSTLDPLLDFFSNAGAMRGKENEAIKLFNRAYAVDELNTIRTLFYLRDIRGGQGERSVFRAILNTLPDDVVNTIAKYIPEYGRWDEVPLNATTLRALKSQFLEDEENLKANKAVSLLAKWLPSENTSSRDTRLRAKEIAKAWEMKPAQYRKRVVALRKHIKLLEQTMSQREWAAIQYDKLPSQAHRKHVKAFKRHDEAGYANYLSKVEKGEAKINAGTLYAYEVYNMIRNNYHGSEDATANAMWKALPDYTNGQNALVVADVSGSMSGLPMSVSVSLALYFAERNTGTFKDYFMTFSDNSKLQHVRGKTLRERMDSIERADWGMSTNLQSAFNAILSAAQADKTPAEDMPTTLYIISDMQFNVAAERNHKTNLEVAKDRFEAAGYKLPHIVFWNVNAYGKEAPATKYDENVTLISGSSQSTFQYVVAGKTPIQSMLDILNSNRYANISL